MKKILVTGATGFLGSAIVKELLNRNEKVRITVRKASSRKNIEGLDAEIFEADINDRESIDKAVDGCTHVYHVAGLYRTWMRDYDQLIKVNVEGTRNVMQAALESGVEKVVHTSSIAALGIRPDGKPSAEDIEFNLHYLKAPYEISKYEAEKVVFESVEKGLNAVIVRPAMVMGEGDIYPTPSGKLVIDIIKGRMPSYFDGGIDVVGINDVVAGHLLAMEKGGKGESYNLGCVENFATMKEIFKLIADEGSVRAPFMKSPRFMALAWAVLITAVSDYITKKEPVATPANIRVLSAKKRVDFTKAVKELGIPQTPLKHVVKSTVDWYRKEGYFQNVSKNHRYC